MNTFLFSASSPMNLRSAIPRCLCQQFGQVGVVVAEKCLLVHSPFFITLNTSGFRSSNFEFKSPLDQGLLIFLEFLLEWLLVFVFSGLSFPKQLKSSRRFLGVELFSVDADFLVALTDFQSLRVTLLCCLVVEDSSGHLYLTHICRLI